MDTPERDDPQGRPQCTAKAKTTGSRCKRTPVPGLDKCKLHCGMKPEDARAKGAENIARQRIGALLAIEAPDHTYADPLDGLLMEVALSAWAVKVLGDIVSGLDALYAPSRKVIAKGETRTVEAGDMKVHIAVQMWTEERDRHARLCKMAIEAGIAERQVRVVEEQGVLFARVVEEVFGDPSLGLDAEKRALGLRLVGRKLRVLQGGRESA